jgi:hypothetical protein
MQTFSVISAVVLCSENVMHILVFLFVLLYECYMIWFGHMSIDLTHGQGWTIVEMVWYPCGLPKHSWKGKWEFHMVAQQRILLAHQLNPLRMEVYFCHQNKNAKNIGNFTTLNPITLVLI